VCRQSVGAQQRSRVDDGNWGMRRKGRRSSKKTSVQVGFPVKGEIEKRRWKAPGTSPELCASSLVVHRLCKCRVRRHQGQACCQQPRGSALPLLQPRGLGHLLPRRPGQPLTPRSARVAPQPGAVFSPCARADASQAGSVRASAESCSHVLTGIWAQ